MFCSAGTPTIILAGKEYGSGSSRDWAAKGTWMLGVKAVIAQSYERIHRSNLVLFGVIPLEFKVCFYVKNNRILLQLRRKSSIFVNTLWITLSLDHPKKCLYKVSTT